MRSLRHLRRLFSDQKPPAPISSTWEEKLQQVKREMVQLEKEKEKESLKSFIPDDSDAEEFKLPKRVEPQTAVQSIFGESSEAEPEPFFLEDIENTAYIYRPTHKLEFDAEGWCVIYSARRKLLYPEKLVYCRKVGFLYLLSLYFISQPFIYSWFTIVGSIVVPSLITLRGCLIDKMWLHQDGKTVKVKYRRWKLIPFSSKISIDSFKDPTGDKFGVWNLYEFPDDLKTYVERDRLQSLGFSKRIKKWFSFLIFPSYPEYVNREVLVNVLNRIQIDTETQGGESIESRYFTLKHENDQKST